MFGTALLLGLISSLHCMGMCGPIAWMLPLDQNNQARKTLQLLTYHMGRMGAYSLLGLMFGLLGRQFFVAGWQQEMSMIAGVFLLVFALFPAKWVHRLQGVGLIYTFINSVKTQLGLHFRKQNYRALFLTGFFNGLLPCGLVYAALFGALLQTQLIDSWLFMILYGAGTIPMMSAVVYLKGLVKFPTGFNPAKLVPVALFFLGSLFVLRGLGLGIPYVSPELHQLVVQANPTCH
ncbi:MAG: hypothetical protein CFE24_06660 [Flavobacterium sp. BFFFF2]|nr:MAG: hypothetical protein CFE24_06660 [Flavobacterium sp. BFFFF2]